MNQYELTLESFGIIGSTIASKLQKQRVQDLYSRPGILDDLPHWFPHVVACLFYSAYPDMDHRTFSFEFNKERTPVEWKMILYDVLNLLLSKYASLLDSNPNKFHFISETEIEHLINEHFASIYSDKPEQKMPKNIYRFIKNVLVTSVNNISRFPILIQIGENVAIGKVSLFFARMLLLSSFDKDKINARMSKVGDELLTNRVRNILEKCGINIHDEAYPPTETVFLQDGKKNSFEIDFLGRIDECLLVMELKSFHPHPFYNSLTEQKRRVRDEYEHFQNVYCGKIVPYLKKSFISEPFSRRNKRILRMYKKTLSSSFKNEDWYPVACP